MAESESKAAEDVEETSDTEESKLEAPVIGDKDKKVEQLTAQMMKNPQVLAALQERLDSLAGTPSGYIESLPRSVKRRINALKNLQVKCTNVEALFYKEVHELERKYAALYQPLFDRRRDVIGGAVEPDEAECEWHEDKDEESENGADGKKSDSKVKNEGKKDKSKPTVEVVEDAEKATVEEETDKDKAKEGEKQKEDKEEEDPKGIPDFWLTVFKNVDIISDLVQEHDEPILRYLKDVQVKFSDPGQPMSFSLEFHFEQNDFFTNAVLTKEYHMRAEPDDIPFSFEGPEITSCTGCKIDWKKGKNVTTKTIKKKQKHKGRGTVRTVTKVVPNESFFNFFNPPQVPEEPDGELDDEAESILATDFEIGHFFRERIVPRAVLYFTGEAIEDEEDDYDEEGQEEEEDEECPEDDDDEDADYDPTTDPSAKQPPECKQQ
uniref:nucleosome assembly protein 1-like 1 n=1 Tax=Myxine glutinosa TaxID=7769 RepID=UPI0035902CD3